MQPIIFSHGLTGQRLTYSAMYMELASCGYCVIALSHNDQSADFTPKAGFYEGNIPIYTYDIKKLQIAVRENEILSLADEIMNPLFLNSVTTAWKKIKLTK